MQILKLTSMCPRIMRDEAEESKVNCEDLGLGGGDLRKEARPAAYWQWRIHRASTIQIVGGSNYYYPSNYRVFFLLVPPPSFLF